MVKLLKEVFGSIKWWWGLWFDKEGGDNTDIFRMAVRFWVATLVVGTIGTILLLSLLELLGILG